MFRPSATACYILRAKKHQGLRVSPPTLYHHRPLPPLPSLPLSRTRLGLTAPWKEGGACTCLLLRGFTAGCRTCSSTRRASSTFLQVRKAQPMVHVWFREMSFVHRSFGIAFLVVHRVESGIPSSRRRAVPAHGVVQDPRPRDCESRPGPGWG